MSLDLKEPFEIDIENVVNDIAAFIRKNVEGAGCKTAIVGLSGGIDSSYIAYLGYQYGLRMFLRLSPSRPWDVRT